MTTNEILALVKTAGKQLIDDYDRASFDLGYKEPDAINKLDSVGVTLGYLARMLERDAYAEAAKSSGRGAQLKAMERIVKRAKGGTYRAGTHGTFDCKSGARAVTDGAMAVRIKNGDVVMPEHIPDGVAPGLDADKVLDPLTSTCVAVELDLAAIKAGNKTKRAELRGRFGRVPKDTGPVWRIENPKTGDFWYYNPQLIIDALEALPGADVYLSTERGDYIYFVSDDGDALVLPLRTSSVQQWQVINPKEVN